MGSRTSRGLSGPHPHQPAATQEAAEHVADHRANGPEVVLAVGAAPSRRWAHLRYGLVVGVRHLGRDHPKVAMTYQKYNPYFISFFLLLTHLDVLCSMGVCYSKMRNSDKSMECYERALPRCGPEQ